MGNGTRGQRVDHDVAAPGLNWEFIVWRGPQLTLH
jgi:hypothetical protein